jgi:hypothetical protein
MRRLPWRRAEVSLAVVTLAALTVEFWFLAEDADADAVIPLLWPVLTGIAALLVLGVVICPRSRTLYLVAITTAITAVATRPFGVLGNYLIGFTRSGWSVWISATIYPSYALLGAVWWFLRVGPWQRRHELRATIPGD